MTTARGAKLSMHKYTAKYLRLSRDDDNSGESDSIAAQRRIIENYISVSPDLAGLPALEFVDDGYSGTSFDRPDVKRLLEAARRGEVGCVIVKDFSRFGRQYLEVGKLIERIFPALGVRFISINDRYDSNTHTGTTADIDVPVRNMINAMYSRDISKKVKSAKRTQACNGVFSNAFAAYGYIKDELDGHRLLIDEPAADIVRRIFTLACEGYSAFDVAGKLNTDGVPPPSVYKRQNRSRLAVSDSARAFWTNAMVLRILRDERYTGSLVSGMRETAAVGSNRKRRVPKEAWVRIPGAIPEIISPEMFNSLASKRKTPATSAKSGADRLLYKKMRCGHCGHILQYTGNASHPYYMCDTARYTMRHGCVREKYRERDILTAVRTAVESQIAVFINAERLLRGGEEKTWRSAEVSHSDVRRDNKIKRAQTLKRQLYERYRRGLLNEAEYRAEREALDTVISAKIAERGSLLAEQDERFGAIHPSRQFFDALIKYRETPDIPDDMLGGFVESVCVYASNRIELHLSFRDWTERISEPPEARNGIAVKIYNGF